MENEHIIKQSAHYGFLPPEGHNGKLTGHSAQTFTFQ